MLSVYTLETKYFPVALSINDSNRVLTGEVKMNDYINVPLLVSNILFNYQNLIEENSGDAILLAGSNIICEFVAFNLEKANISNSRFFINATIDLED